MDTKIPKFRRCVIQNFPFIEADFDALTDYGLVSKIVEYLNNVITQTNTTTENMQNLQAAFNTLKDYVDHYFDNLDVQEEINNKLDEMALDGTLTNLISVYLNPIVTELTTNINSTLNEQNERLSAIENEVEAVASGTPEFVSSTSYMSDTTKAYVNTTDGYLYTYNGSTWVARFIYQATGVADGSITADKFKKYAIALASDRTKQDLLNKFNKIDNVDWVINGLNSSGYRIGYDTAIRLATKFYLPISSNILFDRLNDGYEYFVNIYSKTLKSASAIDFSDIDFESGFISNTGEVISGNNSIVTSDYFEVTSGHNSLEVDKLMFDIRVVEYDKVTSEQHAIYQSTSAGSTLPSTLSTDYKYKITFSSASRGAANQFTVAEILTQVNANYIGTMYTQLYGSGWKNINMTLDGTTYAGKMFAVCVKRTDGGLCEDNTIIFGNDLRTPLANKTVSVLGDSFSAYAGQIPEGNQAYYTGSNSGVSNYHQMWWARLIENNGAKQGVIEAWSGSNVSSIRSGSGTPMSDSSRCENLGTPDVIVIMGGTNDFSHSPSLLGDFNGTQTFPTTTENFADAYAVMLSKIVDTYPNATVFCCGLPLFVRTNTNKDECERNTETDSTHKTIYQYSEKIREIAHIMNCQYIDLNECGFNRENYYDTYCQDSASTPTHPNAKGQEVIYKCIENKVIEVLNNLK